MYTYVQKVSRNINEMEFDVFIPHQSRMLRCDWLKNIGFKSNIPTFSRVYEEVFICGVTRTTRRSGWTLPKVLRPFSGNFQITHLGCTTSKARLLVFGRDIVNECHDVTYDVTVPHVHRSCDLLL